MADSERKRRVEHAHETQRLTYGHFGTATYETQGSRQWRFLRSDGNDTSNATLGGGNTPTSWFRFLHQRVVRIGDEDSSQDAAPVRLSRQPPDIAFASLAVLESNGATKTNSPKHVLPLTGHRLCFGTASRLNARGQPISSFGTPIIALATGDAHEDLRISPIDSMSVSVDDGSGFDTDINIPATSDNGFQYQSPTPQRILQISFSSHHSLLGVRTATSTTLLRPLLSRSRGCALKDSECSGRPSPPLQIDHVMTIPSSRTGGHSHAHFAFNPRNERELALIDMRGVWSVWELRGKSSSSARVLLQAHLRSSGRLLPPEFGKRSDAEDGWHRMCWLETRNGSAEVLFVASRQHAAVFDTSGENLGVVDMRIGVKAAKHGILDVQPCAAHPDMCYVLTSSRLMIMRLALDVLDSERTREPLELICSWNHFRGPQDLSLGMDVLEMDHGKGRSWIHIFLYSGWSKGLTLYTVMMDTQENDLVASVQDPSAFPLADLILKAGASIADVALRVVGRNGRLAVHGDSDDEIPGHGVLVTLLVWTRDNFVSEAVYEYRNPGFSSDRVCPAKGSLHSSRRNHNVVSSRYADDEDDMGDFVVEDSENVLNRNHKDELAAKQVYVASPMPNQTRNWADLLSSETTYNASINIGEQLSALRSMLTEDTDHYSKTLADMMSSAGLGDIVEASDEISSFIDKWLRGDSAVNEANTSLFPVTNDTSESVLDVCNGLVDDYVSTYPAEVPDRLRVNTERQLRDIALEKILASYVLHRKHHDGVEIQKDLQPGEVSDQIGEALDDNARPHTSARSHADDKPISRLSRYTTICPTVPRIFNKQAVTELMGHLPTDISTDPSHYSYRDTELELSEARNRLGTDSEADLRKPTRRHDRKRLDRFRKTKDDIAVERAMAPNVIMSSQLPQVETSQSSGSQAISATQPERGAYGTRQRNKPGKKRMAGF